MPLVECVVPFPESVFFSPKKSVVPDQHELKMYLLPEGDTTASCISLPLDSTSVY